MTNLEELINEGHQFHFENNKVYSYGDFFSAVTPEFLAWFSKVENYIISNYDESSGPYRMLISVKKARFNGGDQSEFEEEFNKIKGALGSCRSLKPNKKTQKSDNLIMALIKNPLLYPVLAVFTSTSYKLAYDNGITKFDSEKIVLEKENTQFKDSINSLNKKIFFLQSKTEKEVPTQQNDTIVNSNFSK